MLGWLSLPQVLQREKKPSGPHHQDTTLTLASICSQGTTAPHALVLSLWKEQRTAFILPLCPSTSQGRQQEP